MVPRERIRRSLEKGWQCWRLKGGLWTGKGSENGMQSGFGLRLELSTCEEQRLKRVGRFERGDTYAESRFPFTLCIKVVSDSSRQISFSRLARRQPLSLRSSAFRFVPSSMNLLTGWLSASAAVDRFLGSVSNMSFTKSFAKTPTVRQ